MPDPVLGVSEAQVATAFAERFDGGNDRLHVSAGFGFVIGRRFQLDAGIDVSEETESVSVSYAGAVLIRRRLARAAR